MTYSYGNAREKIQQSFTMLLMNQSFESIKITEIAKEAKINRSTYYYHYYEKEEILWEVVGKCTYGLVNAIKTPYLEMNELEINGSVLPSTRILFEYVYRQRIFFKTLLNCEFTSKFQSYFIEILENYFRECFLSDDIVLHNEDKLTPKFYAYGILGLITDWVNNDFTEHPTIIAEQFTFILDHKLDKVKIKIKE